MPRPAPAGPVAIARCRPPWSWLGLVGEGARPGAVVARRSPLGEPAAPSAARRSDRRRARASFPPGDSLFSERAKRASDQGGAQVGGSRGEGRGGGSGGQSVRRRARRRPGPHAGAEPRAVAFCKILALATVSPASPLTQMQRPCRGVRCERKPDHRPVPQKALASEAPRQGSAYEWCRFLE